MPRQAFPVRARLTRSQPFKALLATKLAVRSERFIVHAVRNQKSFARLGIIVGKRLVNRAVGRNFLKRLVRETFRHQQSELCGYDVLVRVRRQVLHSESKVAAAELANLFAALVK